MVKEQPPTEVAFNATVSTEISRVSSKVNLGAENMGKYWKQVQLANPGALAELKKETSLVLAKLRKVEQLYDQALQVHMCLPPMPKDNSAKTKGKQEKQISYRKRLKPMPRLDTKTKRVAKARRKKQKTLTDIGKSGTAQSATQLRCSAPHRK